MSGTKRKRISTPVFSSDPAEGSEWPTPKRTRVKQMKKLGYTGNEIRQETGVPRSTQYTIYEETSHRPDKERSGRPLKMDQNTIQKMIKALQGKYNQRKKPWDLIAEEFTRSAPEHPPLKFGPPLSARIVKRYMNDADYHKCRACQKSWISEEQAKNRLH